MQAQLDLMAQRLERESAARLEAERLLELKTQELLDTNTQLQKLVVELDQEVARRTAQALTSRDEAVAANQAKGAFLANMSHEIRTPLASILGFAELLLDQRTGVSQEDALGTIMDNGRHLLQVISDILDVSKIEAEGLELEIAEVRLAAMLKETELLMGPRAREKGLHFQLQAELPLPAVLRSDSVRLKQVLLNFCSNAIKFTASGSVTLRARVLEGHALELAVIDTGIGLTQDQIGRLFQPFAQADVSTTRRFGGTGLGLYICKQLATLLGGSLDVQAHAGRGSVFALRIPLPTAGLQPDVPWIRTREELALAGTLNDIRDLPIPSLAGAVLVAEDNLDSQRLITAYLQCTGAAVRVVDNGEQAVQEALSGAYDLLLMDIQMPVLDGVSAISLLRRAGYRGAVVALTANAMRADIELYRRLGCQDVLAKPIDRVKLHEVLSRFLTANGAERKASLGSNADAVVQRLAAEFVANMPDTQDALREALAAADWPKMRSLTHQLKGLAGSLGYAEVTSLAAPIERQIDAAQFDLAQRSGLQLMKALRGIAPSTEPPADEHRNP